MMNNIYLKITSMCIFIDFKVQKQFNPVKILNKFIISERSPLKRTSKYKINVKQKTVRKWNSAKITTE